jgi:hypothetical protein
MSDVEILAPGTFELLRHLRTLDSTIERVLGGLSDEKIAKAGLRDTAIAYGVLIDKKQLLEGKPTQILSIEERRELKDFLPALLREMERRQITVRADPVVEATVVQPARTGLQTKRLRKV